MLFKKIAGTFPIVGISNGAKIVEINPIGIDAKMLNKNDISKKF